MRFALINQTDGLVSDHELQTMIHAMAAQGAVFSRLWGLSDPTFEGKVLAEEDVPSDFVRVYIVKGPVGGDGVRGYHDDAQTFPYLDVDADELLQAGGGVLKGGTIGVSLASVVMRDLCNLVVNPDANLWELMPDGKRYQAKEVSDPVAGVGIGTADVLLSSAVLPAYFDPQDTKGPFDLAGVLYKPFSLGKGGWRALFDSTNAAGPIVEERAADVSPYLLARALRDQSRYARAKRSGPDTPKREIDALEELELRRRAAEELKAAHEAAGEPLPFDEEDAALANASGLELLGDFAEQAKGEAAPLGSYAEAVTEGTESPAPELPCEEEVARLDRVIVMNEDGAVEVVAVSAEQAAELREIAVEGVVQPAGFESEAPSPEAAAVLDAELAKQADEPPVELEAEHEGKKHHHGKHHKRR